MKPDPVRFHDPPPPQCTTDIMVQMNGGEETSLYRPLPRRDRLMGCRWYFPTYVQLSLKHVDTVKLVKYVSLQQLSVMFEKLTYNVYISHREGTLS